MKKIPCPLWANSEKFPDGDALAWGRRSISWSHLNDCVQSTARYLKEITVRPGTHVAVLSENSVEYVIVLLALWRIGACVMPLSIHLPSSLRDNCLRDFAAGFLLTSAEGKAGSKNVKVVNLGSAVAYQFTDGFLGREERLCPSVDLDAAAAVVLTSGSSGAPKGALLSYGNLFSNAVGANERIPFQPGDRWLLSLPLWHVSGLGILFRALASGGSVVIPSPGQPLDLMVARDRPTHISLVPSQLRALISADLSGAAGPSGIKAVLLGGAPIPPDLAKAAVAAGLPVFATYGLTETASQVATGRIDADGEIAVLPLKDREVRISSEGEVLVRGPVVFDRYLFGSSDSGKDADGWFHTRDFGSIGPDGRLRITGRMDNMFISGGENVHPEAIEKMLLMHSAIESALVIGIKDEVYGVRPAAFLKMQDGVRVEWTEIQEFLRTRLARHELPAAYYSWPEDLSTPGIKLPRKTFQELASRGEAKPLS